MNDNFDELLSDEDEWENIDYLEKILEDLPVGWHLIKISHYDDTILRKIDEWLIDNCQHEYERVGWESTCAYMVGVKFQDAIDATYFRLRWC